MVKSAAEKNAYKKKWYAENRERHNEASAAWYAANKEHAKQKSREWVENNRDQYRANQTRWRRANKDKHRKANTKYRLKKFYGITPEQRDAMFASQGFVCKCCGSDDPKASNGWHVDHCHKTGLVRGILCQQCNIMIGCAADDPRILMKGAQYLVLS